MLGTSMLAIFVASLVLRYLAKLRWSSSLEISLTGFTFAYLLIGIPSTIFQADQQNVIPIPIIFLDLLFLIFAFLLHYIVFTLLNSKPKTRIALAIILTGLYLAVPYIFARQLGDLHQQYEVQRGIKEDKSLSFQVYAPSYAVKGFSPASVGSSPGNNDPYFPYAPSYSITYSTHAANDTLGATSYYLHEEKLEKQNLPCELSNPTYNEHRGECQKLGDASKCTVYYQSPTSEPDSADSYCIIKNTYIKLSVYRNEISKEDILKIFDTMKLADLEALQKQAPPIRRDGF
jgi:hypothetical protein